MYYNNGYNYNSGYANDAGCCPTRICPVQFRFLKIDGVTGQGIAGAVFELRKNSQMISRVTSGMGGETVFTIDCPGDYTIVEVSAPLGYIPNPMPHPITVDCNGGIWVNGVCGGSLTITNTPILTGDFTLTKVDSATSTPLSGAIFTLAQNGITVQTATSNGSGNAVFPSLEPGTYQLTETTPPVGYAPNATTYTVVVENDGTVTVNGLPAAGFQIPNTAILRNFQFSVVDSITGVGLEDGVFTLSIPALFHRAAVDTQASDAQGIVRFTGIASGTYILEQISPPAGYELNTTTYIVIVANDGMVTIDGILASQFEFQNTEII